jgi:hypothetical protein
MLKTVSVYNEEVIKEISKPLAKKAIVTSAIFTAIMFALGVFMTIHSIVSQEENKVFNIIIGAITVVFSFYPLYKALRQNKENLKTAITDLGVDKNELKITMVVREKRIEVTSEQGGAVKNSTVLLRNISEAKINKKAIGIYVKDNMYYVLDSDYIEGSKQEFINILRKAGVKIKGKQ